MRRVYIRSQGAVLTAGGLHEGYEVREGLIGVEAADRFGEQGCDAYRLERKRGGIRQGHAIRYHDPPDGQAAEPLKRGPDEETVRGNDGDLGHAAGGEERIDGSFYRP